MAKEVYLRKIIHDTYGELYQFLELDPAIGEEQAVSPFEAGMFRELEQEPELLYIQSKRGADAVGYCKVRPLSSNRDRNSLPRLRRNARRNTPDPGRNWCSRSGSFRFSISYW